MASFSLSSFTFIKRLFSSSSLSAIRVESSAYLRLLIFLPAILIPACASSSPAFLMTYSEYSDDGGLRMIRHTPETKRARRTIITKLRALVNKMVVADPVDFVSNDKNIQEFVSAPELRCEKGALALARSTDDALCIEVN